MYSAENYKLILAGETHTGLCSKTNEDNFCYLSRADEINQMAMIADGIGGHADGALASRLCCQIMLKAWNECGVGHEVDPKKIQQSMINEAAHCNSLINQMNQNRNGSKIMGTTLVVAVFTPNHIIIGHVGDSRFYCFEDSTIEFLTRDHSLVMELAQQKMISASEMNGHPYSHIILRAIGTTPHIKIETKIHKRHSGQRFLLCSDGLNRHLSDPQILGIIQESESPREAVDALIRSTLRSGAQDNVTAICAFH